jgi:hypothetical protein
MSTLDILQVAATGLLSFAFGLALYPFISGHFRGGKR